MSIAIIVEVDADLEDLVPAFMQRRHQEVGTLRAALVANDFDAIRITGHSLKGTGGGYGFHQLSTIGGAIETAALAADTSAIASSIEEMEDFLARVKIVYE